MSSVNSDAGRNAVVRELISTQRAGIDTLVAFLDKYGFFEAGYGKYEPGRGGAVNHSLWVLDMARRERERFISAYPATDIPEHSLTILCLLHELCCCPYPEISGKKAVLTGGPRSEAILQKSGFVLTDDERMILRSCSFSKLPARTDTPLSAQLLHFLLHETCRKATEYAAGIPFGTEPVSIAGPEKGTRRVNVFFDSEDHRTWWNASDTTGKLPDISACADTEKLIQMRVRHLFSMKTDAEPSPASLSVLSDDYGTKAILTTFTNENGVNLMYSDRACFDYRNYVFLISRYPRYRASYVIAQRQNGKWGAFMFKTSQGKIPVVKREKVLNYDFNSYDDALKNMCEAGRRNFKIRVSDPAFYTKITF